MNKPILYLMLGYPGAGKTTTAKVIEELTGAERISSDEYRFKLFTNPVFTSTEHNRLYKELDQKTKTLLQSGKSVIYDANLNRYQHRQDKYRICRTVGAQPVLLWVQTPKEIAKSRAVDKSRAHLIPPGETAEQLFERITEIIETPHLDEKPIIVDGTKVTSDYLKKLLKI